MDSEKGELPEEKIVAVDQLAELSSSGSLGLTEAQGFDQKATRRLVRKLDWHLIPFLSLIYLYVLWLLVKSQGKY
jgi:hypothetical protein